MKNSPLIMAKPNYKNNYLVFSFNLKENLFKIK